jgi:hypothetical protein
MEKSCKSGLEICLPIPNPQTRMVNRPQKITLGEMREMGVRGVLVYCSDYHCSHWGKISADRWGRIIRGCLIFSRYSFVRLAAPGLLI